MSENELLEKLKNKCTDEAMQLIQEISVDLYSDTQTDRTVSYIAGIVDCLNCVKRIISKFETKE